MEFSNRIYSLHELKELLEQSGWKYRHGFGAETGGDIDLVPLNMDLSRMWVVAQKQSAERAYPAMHRGEPDV